MKILKRFVLITLVLGCICCIQQAGLAEVKVQMQLNEGGFESFDHFKAELLLNNDGNIIPGVDIFGLLEILGEYYYWPDFSTVVNFQVMDIDPDDMSVLFLEFDFPDIDDLVPFGPMQFWGAWYVDMDHYGLDVKAFGLGSEFKWTPTPIATSSSTLTPTLTPSPYPTSSPTKTPAPPTATSTATPTPSWTPVPPTATFTAVPTNTFTPLPTWTDTPVPPTATSEPTETETPIETPTQTDTPTPDLTGTPEPTTTPGGHTPGDLYAIDGIAGNMRYVPATDSGGFIQGSLEDEPCRFSNEDPFSHKLSRSLAVMETEVTRQMWADLQSVQPDLPDDPSLVEFSPSGEYPVQQIAWYETILFANLLSLQNGHARCYFKNAAFTVPVDAGNYTSGPYFCNFDADGYRLLTEGEWEYSCRSGTAGAFCVDEPGYLETTCGEPYCVPGKFPDLEFFCWFCANAAGQSAPAGTRQPNVWNIMDMHGNVYEWCWDWYAAAYPVEGATDYTGPATGSYRIIRGGSWFDKARYCRSAFRSSSSPLLRLRDLGFRLARAIL